MNAPSSSISPAFDLRVRSLQLGRLLACTLVCTFLALPALQAQEAEVEAVSPEPVPQRLVNLCGTSVISPDDIRFLESFTSQQQTGACIAYALLYKFLAERYTAAFQSYFRIDFTAPKKIIPNDELAQRVDAIETQFRGRSQVELVARLYNEFRGSSLYKQESPDSVVSLELFYRTSLFQNTMQGALQNALRLAAQADKQE